MANRNAENLLSGPDVHVVAPSNIGKGIIWNPVTKQYEVNIGDGLEINPQGKVVAKIPTPEVRTQDNGTGVVIHKQTIIDYGGVIEVSGRATLPLPNKAQIDMCLNNPTAWGIFRLSQDKTKPKMHGVTRVDVPTAQKMGLALFNSTEMYYAESNVELDFRQFGMKEVISVSATSGDTLGYKAEGAWAVDLFDSNSTIMVGVHVYYSPDENLTCALNYTIKGIKA